MYEIKELEWVVDEKGYQYATSILGPYMLAQDYYTGKWNWIGPGLARTSADTEEDAKRAVWDYHATRMKEGLVEVAQGYCVQCNALVPMEAHASLNDDVEFLRADLAEARRLLESNPADNHVMRIGLEARILKLVDQLALHNDEGAGN